MTKLPTSESLVIISLALLLSSTASSSSLDVQERGDASSSPSGGKYLFYMPYVTRSMKITFMPLVNELANRGHQVHVL